MSQQFIKSQKTISPSPNKEKSTFLQKNRLLLKMQIRKALNAICQSYEQEIEESLQNDLDFWCMAFPVEFITLRNIKYIATMIYHSNHLKKGIRMESIYEFYQKAWEFSS